VVPELAPCVVPVSNAERDRQTEAKIERQREIQR